jgi:NAD(P)-dependent dehydrogenase (short-subunit alcohol dehydrogenase family)
LNNTIERKRIMAIQDEVAEKQKAIQSRQDQLDASASGGEESKEAVQTGPVTYPGPPLPGKHLSKPGSEADMELRPMFMAEHYKGSAKLQGQVAIVTGGDSGIGRAVAVLFAREGADVAIFYLNEHEDAAETQRCIEAEGQRCVTVAGDVKDMEFCQEAVDKVVAEWGRLDVLVNNAAFQEHAGSLLDLTEERFDETMRTNIYGYFHMAKAALPYLKRGSAIINTGSVTGLKGSKKLLDYSTTKGAIHAFTMSLAANLLDQGIRVNAVAPGPVWTPLNPADQAPDKIAQFGAETSYRRPAQPEELSPAYVFLASAVCSSYITGIVLPVTGYVGE